MMRLCELILLLAVVAPSQSNPIGLGSNRLVVYGQSYKYVTGPASRLKICLNVISPIGQFECFEFGIPLVERATYQRTSTQANLTELRANLPRFQTSLIHQLEMKAVDRSDRTVATVQIYGFGNNTAMYVKAEPLLTGNIVMKESFETVKRSHNWTVAEAQAGVYLDLLGCKFEDGVRAIAGSSVVASCHNYTCNNTAHNSSVSLCGPKEMCKNSICTKRPVCSVSANTIIDFHNNTDVVLDRCTYGLFNTSTFVLGAVFRERRREDVPLLDHLILWVNNTQIYFEQGGRVLVKNQPPVTFSSGTRMVHGVELSKDRSGITAKISDMEIFFDGFNAILTGFTETNEGLCGNSRDPGYNPSVKSLKLSQFSTSGCEKTYSSPADPSINCTSTHCDLLLQSPFTSCHADIPPRSYVSSCNRTMCSYPAMDDLNCQFINAYAKACDMIGISIPDWKSHTKCSGEALCQGKYCSDHEFCGKHLSGESRCLCRATFASNYTQTNTFGEPTVCMQNSANVTLAECLLAGHGIEYTKLHLNDQNCTGQFDSETHMVEFSFNSSNTCGTETVKNNSQLIYKNSIVTRNISANEVITRHDQVEIDFSCYYTQPDNRSVSFKIKDSSVVQTIVSGSWNYTLNMTAYTDPGLRQRIEQNTEIKLNQQVWVELNTTGLDEGFLDLVTDSCWATNQQSAIANPRYNLITNGCPNPTDKTVQLRGNGRGLSNSFSFNMFEFSGGSSEIYLHCRVELCLKRGSACVPVCSGRKTRRSVRSASADKNPALITMAWDTDRLL